MPNFHYTYSTALCFSDYKSKFRTAAMFVIFTRSNHSLVNTTQQKANVDVTVSPCCCSTFYIKLPWSFWMRCY